MFYSTYVLTKKGALAKVWLAAHWDRRLTRNEVKVVDLNETILHIVRPVVPIALRTSGELLVGVVRIYALKVRHLLKEATEATLLLRVTVLKSGGASLSLAGAGKKGPSAGITGADNAAPTTLADAALAAGKGGDVEAVTLDWSMDGAAAAGRRGATHEAAEALAEARFDAIADLLDGAKRGEMSGQRQQVGFPGDDILAPAWYSVEPTSQAVEELHSTQQEYDEIARMRADLMAFGDRSSTSKSKSSLGSIEKGRGSVLDGVPFPPVTEELDIGVALPDELHADFASLHQPQSHMPEDPFALPEMLLDNEQLQQQQARARRARTANVVDLAATTTARETIEKAIADRSDILSSEPRRGPLDETEERDRYTITGTANPTDPIVRLAAMQSAEDTGSRAIASADYLSIADAAPLSELASPALRVLFASVLRQSVVEAVEEAAAARSAQVPVGCRSAAAVALGVPEDPDYAQQQDEMTGRKRDRADDENMDAEAPGGLSTSALRTLDRIREVAARASSPDRKRARQEESVSLSASAVGGVCTLKVVTHAMRRRDAARTFVDLMTLASRQLVDVRQEAPAADVAITIMEPSAAIPTSA